MRLTSTSFTPAQTTLFKGNVPPLKKKLNILNMCRNVENIPLDVLVAFLPKNITYFGRY